MRQSKLCVLAAGLSLVTLVPAHGAPQSAPAATPVPAPAAITAERPQVFLAVYERGPAWNVEKGTMEQAGIEEHRQYLRANASKLLAAGRFEQGSPAGASDRTVGTVVVAAANQAEAEAFFAADPAITGNLMKVTVRHWLVQRIKTY